MYFIALVLIYGIMVFPCCVTQASHKSLHYVLKLAWQFKVNRNEQTFNNSGGPEKGYCVRQGPRIFQSGGPQALASLAGHLSPDKMIRQFCYYQ